MALLSVTGINLFGVTTGNKDIDTVIADRLLHLELQLHNEKFIMSSIPQYIARTLYDHTQNKNYKHRYMTLLNQHRIPGDPFHRVESVNLSIKFDNRHCRFTPLCVMWCTCDECTAIDMSTYTTLDGKPHGTDAFTGLLLAAMYNAPILCNGQVFHTVKPIQLEQNIALSLQGKDTVYLLHPPEALVALFTHFDFLQRHYSPKDDRFSIEAVVMLMNKLQRVEEKTILLREVRITGIQFTGTYIAEVKIYYGKDPQFIQMIPSHAVLLSTVLGQGELFVDEVLI